MGLLVDPFLDASFPHTYVFRIRASVNVRKESLVFFTYGHEFIGSVSMFPGSYVPLFV